MYRLIQFRNELDKEEQEKGVWRKIASMEKPDELVASHGIFIIYFLEKMAEGIMNQSHSLHLLWTYRCDLSRGRRVNSIVCNKLSEDVIAVGYGECSTSTGAPLGMILCWSIKNPEVQI